MGSEKVVKRATGGSAAERGLDFQSRVSAIVMAHLLVERPIGWLEGVLDDTPLQLDAETGGPGDDIRFVGKGDKQVELQVKRGLQRGGDLWAALLALAHAVSTGKIDAGVLAVCPNSSGTIRETLAEDIARLGTGRSDGLREIGKDWATRLSAASLDARLVCRNLRIVVVSAVDGNREAEATASERLSRVVDDPQSAWQALVDYGRSLIRRRGRTTAEDIYRNLSLARVALKTSDICTRVQLLAAIREWLHCAHVNMTLLGVHGAVPFEACWLRLDAYLLDEGQIEQEALDKALRRYHEYGHGRRHGGQSFHSQTIGRFVKNCVVVGGPGIGKSTLLKKLALDYSADGLLTLLVRLPQVVALVTREGRRFEDSLLEVALSASGIRTSFVSLEGAVVLCDALDECGNQQPLVTAALHAFSVAHPRTRIVVTSRPIGYRPGELAGWRHYELHPLSDTGAERAVLQVLQAIPFADEAARSRAIALAKDQLRAQSIRGAASRSPLMITLLAALSAKGIYLGHGKASLYRQLFQLLEDHPPPRLAARPPSEPERSRLLEMLGWCFLSHGNEEADQTLSRCARWWSEETGHPSLVSEAKVRECLEYWECLGVVERVRTLTQEAITFVHKTFGEFAAGRYMSKCDPASQRGMVERAIRTPEWKETLSFASHLGLGSLILQVWGELAERGDTKAGNGLDDAVELVVQAGVSITADALADFALCCWTATENTASRVRYAAGEALCLISRDHWNVTQQAALARLNCADPWLRLVAWACRCVSSDRDLAISALTAALRSLDYTHLTDSYLTGWPHLGSTGRAVCEHLVIGAARRILISSPDPEALQVLNDLIGNEKNLSLAALEELQELFNRAGLALTTLLDKWSLDMDSFMSSHAEWKREQLNLIELIDDPLMIDDGNDGGSVCHSLELGALLTASSYWDLPVRETLHMSTPASASAFKRTVIHAVARAAGLDRANLVRQARTMKKQAVDGEKLNSLALLAIPHVDVVVDFDQPLVSVEFMAELEKLILGTSHFFALNAARLLHGVREQSEYPSAIERLLIGARSESLQLSAALASKLPDGSGQQLLLDRLCRGDITSGCLYLYPHLTPPFSSLHLEAVRKGLEGPSAKAATAAAELAAKMPVNITLAKEWRVSFDQWKTKEEPYPTESGVVPDSPRKELAKILIQVLADDHDFLMELLADDRPDVRVIAQEPVLTAAVMSQPLRQRMLEGVQNGILEPTILRAAVSRGLYLGTDAMLVVPLLSSSDARVRYAALSILDAKFLPSDLIQAECARLMTDTSMDIREGAVLVLQGLESPKADC